MFTISLLAKSFAGCGLGRNTLKWYQASDIGQTFLPGSSWQGLSPACLQSAASVSSKPAMAMPVKKPLTSFFLYMTERRSTISASRPDLTFKQVIKLISEEWNTLPDDQKKEYVTKGREALEKYKAAEEKWWASLTNEQRNNILNSKKEIKESIQKTRLKRKLRALGKPIRAKTAMNFYLSSQIKPTGSRESLKVRNVFQKLLGNFQTPPSADVNPGASNAKLQQVSFSEAAKKWKGLSDEEKRKYVELAEKDKLRHKSEHEAWILKMMKEGQGSEIRKIAEGLHELRRKAAGEKPDETASPVTTSKPRKK